MITPIILGMMGISYYLCSSVYEFLQVFAFWFTLGVAIMWTLLEYVQHRFILHQEIHLDPNEPWSEAGGERNADYFSRHIHHHVFMNQRFRIALNLRSYAEYMICGIALFHVILEPRVLYMLASGWISGSLLYDGIHLAFHFEDMYQLPFAWYQDMKSAHMRHHYRDNSREFGVTTAAWDHIMGTEKHIKN